MKDIAEAINYETRQEAVEPTDLDIRARLNLLESGNNPESFESENPVSEVVDPTLINNTDGDDMHNKPGNLGMTVTEVAPLSGNILKNLF